MVEAARIELASEDTSTLATTCFSYLLIFVTKSSDMQDQFATSSNKDSQIILRAKIICYPAKRRPFLTREQR